MKIKDWINATKISNSETKRTPEKGSTFKNDGARIANVAKIVNTLCPANIFANNLTASEKGLANWLTISNGIKKINIGFGMPCGIRFCTWRKPWAFMPVNWAMIKTKIARDPVTLTLLIGDSPPGNNPEILFTKTNKNNTIKNANQIGLVVLIELAKASETKSKK